MKQGFEKSPTNTCMEAHSVSNRVLHKTQSITKLLQEENE